MSAQFFLYQSNSLSALAEEFAATLNRFRANPLRPESVIIQTTGMETWLTQQIAKRNDIFAAVEFIRPANFLLRLNARLTDQSEEKTVFEADNMRWFIYREISENPARYPMVEEYLSGGDGELRQQKLFTFASEAAEMIDSYILYRPEILEAWERDEFAADAVGNELFTGQTRKHEEWQKELWQAMLRFHNQRVEELGAKAGQNPVRVLTELGKLLADPNPTEKVVQLRQNTVPVALFGMSVLPPRYMELFKLLSNHVQVELYVINPSQFYWGDLETDRHISFRMKKNPAMNTEAEYLLMGNRLLRNLGEAGRDFYHSLYETAEQINIHEEERFREPETESLLHEIQRDILSWNDDGRADHVILPADSSVTINRCYTPLREVEVLYDYLLDRFEQDPTLTMGDILVITPDIETYAPLITMMFSRESRLKGSVADRSVIAENTVLQLIKEILSLPETRFTAPEVVSLFEQYSRFTDNELSIRDEEKVQKWVRESGIRWGTDAVFWQRRTNSDFGEERFSWRSGLDRMFQGFAAGDDDSWDIPSYTEIEGSDGELLGRLAAFVRSLSNLEELSRRTMSIEEWSDRFIGWFRELFLYDEGENEDSGVPVLADIIKDIRKLSDQASITKDDADRLEISFGTMRSALVQLLEDEESSAGFLRGTITFASTMPLRSIPFRIVGCIGMNHNTFPRVGNARSYDLIKAQPRRGDRDMRKGDLYLFLETIISAKDAIYISATAFDEKSGEPQPVSSVVEQLENYIEDNYLFVDETEEPEQLSEGESFSLFDAIPEPSAPVDSYNPLKRICTTHPLHPFSLSYLNDPKLFTYQKQWFPQEEPEALFEDSLFDISFDSSIDTVTYPMLLNYLENPLKDLFENLCGMTFTDDTEEVPEEEPFNTDHLRDYLLRGAGVQEWIGRENYLAEIRRELFYKGELPAGASLESSLESIGKAVNSFKTRIPETIIGLEPESVSYQSQLNGIDIRLESDPLYHTESELILVDPGKLERSSKTGEVKKLKRLIKLYLNWLIANTKESTTMKLITLDATVWYPGTTPTAAEERLAELVDLYLKSRTRFLPYFGRASQTLFHQKTAVAEILEKLTEESFMSFTDFHETLFITTHRNRFTVDIEEEAAAIAESLFLSIASVQSGK